MTINERIRYLRKEVLHMNQRQFAASLGMSQTGISGTEQSGSNVPDSTIKLICSTHSISEAWLRTGDGPIRIEPDTFSLDQYAKDHGCTELELEILKAYFELDPSIRETVVNHFRDRLTFTRQPPPPSPDLADLAARVDALEKEEEIGSRPPVPAKSISRSR